MLSKLLIDHKYFHKNKKFGVLHMLKYRGNFNNY